MTKGVLRTKTQVKLLRLSLLLTFGLNILVFAYYYLFGMLIVYNPAIVYVMPALFDLTVLLTPVIVASFMIMRRMSLGRGLLFAILPNLSRAAYAIPMYYLQFVVFEDYDSIDALLYGLFPALLWVLLSYALSILAYLIIKLFIYKGAKSGADADKIYKPSGLLNFENPLSRGFAAVALLGFTYELITQLVTTISYLTEYAGDYAFGDIAYMLICYVFALCLFFILYITPELIRKLCSKKDVADLTEKVF